MLRCNPEAFAKCPTRKLCGNVHEATFTEDSECARFNRSVMDKPMTNADRIRAMSNGVLAQSIQTVSLGYAPWCNLNCRERGDGQCCDCIRIWLKQPAEPANLPDEDDRDSGLLEED